MATAVDSYTDFQRFSALRNEAGKDPHAALATVAKEFEALFIQMMLKSARDAMPADGEMSSHEEQFYREMFDNQIALQMADEGRLGFKAMLARQLPQIKAANTGPVELKLPERKIFPDIATPYIPRAEPAVADDEVVDIATWSSWSSQVGIESTEDGYASALFSDTSAAAVDWGNRRPRPGRSRATSPGGRRHRPRVSRRRSATRTADSDGFHTTAFPATRACAIAGASRKTG